MRTIKETPEMDIKDVAYMNAQRGKHTIALIAIILAAKWAVIIGIHAFGRKLRKD